MELQKHPRKTTSCISSSGRGGLCCQVLRLSEKSRAAFSTCRSGWVLKSMSTPHTSTKSDPWLRIGESLENPNRPHRRLQEWGSSIAARLASLLLLHHGTYWCMTTWTRVLMAATGAGGRWEEVPGVMGSMQEVACGC